MKKLVSLTIAAMLIGFGVFALMYWVAGSSLADARGMAITVGVTGFIIEYLRPYIIRWAKMLDLAARRKTSKK